MQTTASVLLYLGLIGAVEFAALAFASAQLGTVNLPARLQRKLANPLVRNARFVIALSAAVAVVGLVLRP